MNCARCKTVELIRVEDSPYNLYPLGKVRPKPVDRCPSCGLEWPVQPPAKRVALIDELPQLYNRKPSASALEYGAEVVKRQREELLQLDLFNPVVGGFAAE
ncbi:hypothetical protein GC101_22040 [Paenibacillus sp. LMG 31459]|uniref:Transposase n=1 Tax=Paenibacillus phytohabitans TaxID=2654978 RepID=A0ABX1YKS4_9BACL|nr:hypothetical protein [Paenibacillus phytohabitans]NOU81547.1 hypothetical protein [Paenibacillus phytohabitans]